MAFQLDRGLTSFILLIIFISIYTYFVLNNPNPDFSKKFTLFNYIFENITPPTIKGNFFQQISELAKLLFSKPIDFFIYIGFVITIYVLLWFVLYDFSIKEISRSFKIDEFFMTLFLGFMSTLLTSLSVIALTIRGVKQAQGLIAKKDVLKNNLLNPIITIIFMSLLFAIIWGCIYILRSILRIVN